MIFDKLAKYALIALAALLFTGLAVQSIRLHATQLELAAVSTEFAQAKAAAAIQVAKQHEDFRKAEISLGNAASQSRKETNDQVRALSARNAALLDRVRRAEAAAATGPQHLPGTGAAAGSGQAPLGGAGPELLRSLGEADVREAERADVIRLHLAACYASYGRAQAALKKLGTGAGTGGAQ